MIKHHNYFKLHLPLEYDENDKDAFSKILMEEAHLYSDGHWTKGYEPKNPKKELAEISIYPSIVYALNKLNKSEQEKFIEINNYIDHSFVDSLKQFSPLHKCTAFIEYHLHYFKGEQKDFFKHIKFQIIPILKEKEKTNTEIKSQTLVDIINDWLDSKNPKNDMSFVNNGNLNINNGNHNKNDSNVNEKEENKTSNWIKARTIIAVITCIIGIIAILLKYFK